MQKGKDYRAVDMLFQILVAYIDRATEFQIESGVTGAHRIYYSIKSKLFFCCYDDHCSKNIQSNCVE